MKQNFMGSSTSQFEDPEYALMGYFSRHFEPFPIRSDLQARRIIQWILKHGISDFQLEELNSQFHFQDILNWLNCSHDSPIGFEMIKTINRIVGKRI